MAAAKFAAKFATVANLKLRPLALYLLGDLDLPCGLYDGKAITAILKQAETKWVSAESARTIARSLQPRKPPQTAAEMFAETARIDDAEQAEVDDILDGPPPELPAAPEAAAADVILPPFDLAIKALTVLQTKPPQQVHRHHTHA